MSEITGEEPQHWHLRDPEGRWHHNMADPRNIGGAQTHWSDDEKAYAAHLTQHETLDASVTPLKDDDPLVRAVLEFVANEAMILDRLRGLAALLRHELAQGTPLADAKSARALKQLLPHLYRSENRTPVPAAAESMTASATVRQET